MDIPTTRYARTADGDSVAYQVLGEGPRDVVLVPGFVSHLELVWTEPAIARAFERLASFSRLILFDKRGTGLSDPITGPLTLEERMEDVRAVMDAAGSERSALLGFSEGGAMSVLFAATYPDRTSALVLCGTVASGRREDHPAGARWDVCVGQIRAAMQSWGDGATIALLSPTGNATTRQRGAFERAGASPRMVNAIVDMWLETDVREVLSTIRVPTLVLHRTDEIFPVEVARDIAARIDGARLVELPGTDHNPWFGDSDAYLSEIEEFLTGAREHSRTDHVLASVLFTDIVNSTERAGALGDTAWRDLIARHDELVRAELRRFDGREVKHTGDGFLASFDGPARAIRCADAITQAAPSELGLELRAGVHTGECELVDGDLRGMAVHIAARVAAEAGSGEVLVSGTVKELVVGSGISFSGRGAHTFKGVPGAWQIYRVSEEGTPSQRPSGDAEPVSVSDRAGLALARRAPRVARALVRSERALAGLTRKRRDRS